MIERATTEQIVARVDEQRKNLNGGVIRCVDWINEASLNELITQKRQEEREKVMNEIRKDWVLRGEAEIQIQNVKDKQRARDAELRELAEDFDNSAKKCEEERIRLENSSLSAYSMAGRAGAYAECARKLKSLSLVSKAEAKP